MSDSSQVSRKLIAVFAADVEGYSGLMGADEVGTLKWLTERRAIFDKLIGDHRGRIANTAGDSVLAEFGSAVDAVQCAMEAQTTLAEANSSVAPDRRIHFRIGIHIGDIMIRAGDPPQTTWPPAPASPWVYFRGDPGAKGAARSRSAR